MSPWATATARFVRYFLVAAVVHTGMASAAGHYLTYRRVSKEGGWVEVSDEALTPISEEKVVSGDATLLFYEQEGMG